MIVKQRGNKAFVSWMEMSSAGDIDCTTLYIVQSEEQHLDTWTPEVESVYKLFRHPPFFTLPQTFFAPEAPPRTDTAKIPNELTKVTSTSAHRSQITDHRSIPQVELLTPP